MCTKYGRSRMNDAYNEHGRLGRPPSKSRTVDSIIFEKEDEFCTTFVSAVGRLTLGVST